MSYIPNYATPLDKMPSEQIRLGIQGPPGEGKTWAALTFPNPLVLNLDRGLGAHIGRTDVYEVPFWDVSFIKKIYNNSDNKRDALNYWLQKEGVKLDKDQTLIIDALTGIQDAHEVYEKNNPTFTKQGKLDDFAAWDNKLSFFVEFCDTLFTLKCNVVLISHETVARNKEGELTGKVKPLLSGQYGDRIAGKFTDWFRQLARTKLSPDKVTDLVTSKFKMTKTEFIEWQNSFPRNTVYSWQTESDDVFSGKCSSLVNFPTYLPANYQAFKKYSKQNNLSNQAQ